MAGRIRPGLSLLNRLIRSESLLSQRHVVQRSPVFISTSDVFRNYATTTKEENKLKVPLALFGAWENGPTFSQFTKDLSVPADTRIKAVFDIGEQAKFSDTTSNFLALLAENGRLRNFGSIAKKFVELTMADKGEVTAIVTTVIPLPVEEEKELKVTLQEIVGQGKMFKLEQKIDPSILGGIVGEFSQKVFDMSIRTRAQQMERFLREPINLDAI